MGNYLWQKKQVKNMYNITSSVFSYSHYTPWANRSCHLLCKKVFDELGRLSAFHIHHLIPQYHQHLHLESTQLNMMIPMFSFANPNSESGSDGNSAMLCNLWKLRNKVKMHNRSISHSCGNVPCLSDKCCKIIWFPRTLGCAYIVGWE